MKYIISLTDNSAESLMKFLFSLMLKYTFFKIYSVKKSVKTEKEIVQRKY